MPANGRQIQQQAKRLERDGSLKGVAITGSTISPSIHESLAMLGKKATLSRVCECLSRR